MTNEKRNKMQGKGTEKQARISFILFLCILALLLIAGLTGCSKNVDIYDNSVEFKKVNSIRIWKPLEKPNVDVIVDTRLPKDQNGYSIFKLYSMETQNLHRITGKILFNGIAPRPSEQAEWESNLYWWINKDDTIVKFTKTYFNEYTGQLTTSQLPALISNVNAIVPTINKTSQSDLQTGEINTIIAPMWEMKGDTMVITCKVKYWYPYETDGLSEKYKVDSITKYQKIILK
jgi:hypothetical protein